MLLAIHGSAGLPKVGKVCSIEDTTCRSEDSKITVEWLIQKQVKNKPRWLRPYKMCDDPERGIIKFTDILLYDFLLTNTGCLKKQSREYLQQFFE